MIAARTSEPPTRSTQRPTVSRVTRSGTWVCSDQREPALGFVDPVATAIAWSARTTTCHLSPAHGAIQRAAASHALIHQSRSGKPLVRAYRIHAIEPLEIAHVEREDVIDIVHLPPGHQASIVSPFPLHAAARRVANPLSLVAKFDSN